MSTKEKKLSRAKRWCYTLNNPTSEPTLATDVVYHVYGREKGESGTPHLQGFVIFNRQKLLTQVLQMIPNCHWEVARGKNSQAANYCKKDGDFVETGELPPESNAKGNEAVKRKYAEFKAHAIAGNFDLIDDDLYARHYRTMKEIHKDHIKSVGNLAGELKNEWYYGVAGAGKSKKAYEENPGAYLKSCNKWWDGYQGEEVVIIDDFDPSHKVLGHHLKQWSHHWEFNAETKGGMLRIRPAKIIVTSQYRIHEIFDDLNTYQAISRRFKEIEIKKEID